MDSLADFTPDNLKQWTLLGSDAKGSHVRHKERFEDRPERNYSLKSRDPRKFLQYEKQDVGINLGWTDDAEPSTAAKVRRWFLNRRGGSDTPVVYGEPVAMGYGRTPSYIRYKQRPVGINLDWSDDPVYEWRFMGGAVGQPVKTGDYFGIYNDASREFLIYFDRTAGGDIGWPSSQTWWKQGQALAQKALEEYVKSQLGGK